MSADRYNSPLEEKLADYWREILKIDKVDPDDHFIDLGGHSMLAMTLLNRLEEDFGVRLQMQDIFNPLRRVAVICEGLVAEQESLTDANSESEGNL